MRARCVGSLLRCTCAQSTCAWEQSAHGLQCMHTSLLFPSSPCRGCTAHVVYMSCPQELRTTNADGRGSAMWAASGLEHARCGCSVGVIHSPMCETSCQQQWSCRVWLPWALGQAGVQPPPPQQEQQHASICSMRSSPEAALVALANVQAARRGATTTWMSQEYSFMSADTTLDSDMPARASGGSED